jgi:heme/copper-type cytochrome/quinol oxidase subunit 4
MREMLDQHPPADMAQTEQSIIGFIIVLGLTLLLSWVFQSKNMRDKF